MIICDSGPLVAAAINDDAFHRQCVDLLSALHMTGEDICVLATVAAEVGYMLGRGRHAEREAQFLESMADGTLTPVDMTIADYQRAGALVRQYDDLPLGTTDASVIAVAERLNVTEIATLDHRHFSVVRPNHVPALTLLPG